VQKKFSIGYVPVSESIPSGLLRRASTADSPPEEPPAEVAVLGGFVVTPKRLLRVSSDIYTKFFSLIRVSIPSTQRNRVHTSP
jgi:hypothetical protein